MKVFISWSGDLSHKIAMCLRDWLPNVIQSLTPYVSSEDIDKGTRWSVDIAGELSTSFYGILCVTEENVSAPWLNFEAGALSKTIDSTNVSPFLFNIKRSDVKGPILQFQSTVFEQEDFRKLTHSIKKADSECKIDDQRFNAIFDVWWPRLEQELKSLASTVNRDSDARKKSRTPNDEILEQILELTRQNTRALSHQEKLFSETLHLNSNVRRHLPDIEPDHPVFRDILGAMEALKTGISVSPQDSEELMVAVRLLEVRLQYLLERLNVRMDFRQIDRFSNSSISTARRRLRNTIPPSESE